MNTVQELLKMDPQSAIDIMRDDVLQGRRPLLGSNTKTEKAKGLGIRAASLSLAPASESIPYGGRNMCPKASEGCAAACLIYAGCNGLPYNSLLRIAKTLVFLFNRDAFTALLNAELERHIRNSLKAGMVPALRSQTLHDRPSYGRKIAQRFPDLRVYDYTALVDYAMCQTDSSHQTPRLAKHFPDNFHLTVSRKEDNHADCIRALRAGVNVAVVFDGPLPATFEGHPVIDGDEHDARFLDPKGVVVGLKLKGTKAAKQAARDSGFAVKTEGNADPIPLHMWA